MKYITSVCIAVSETFALDYAICVTILPSKSWPKSLYDNNTYSNYVWMSIQYSNT